MKIELWHNILWSRYKARVFSELGKQCAASGDDLLVYQIAETDSDRAVLSGVDMSLHDYPMVTLFKGSYSRIPKAALFSSLARHALKTDADVTLIAGMGHPEYWVQALILFLRRRKMAVFCDSTLYDNPQTFLKTLLKRLFFKMCPNAFCYGQRSAEYLKFLGVSEKTIRFRRQAAGLPVDYREDAIVGRRIEMAPSHPVFVFVGRLSPEKRIDTLLRSFAKVLPVHPSARLRIIGSGPQKDALVALADELKIAANVDFAGSLSGQPLYDSYLGATAMVLPSWSEPWGLVVNEALHYGCPVIVSNRCGCVPELVENSASGTVFPCDDVDALAEQLVRAPEIYADARATATACLAKIAPYSSKAAAQEILAGVRELSMVN